MAAHRSVRSYEPTAVPEGDIRLAVGAARQASTSSHVQGYALLQVVDAAKRARLRELCGDQEQVERAGAFFVVCAEQRRHRLVAEEAGTPLACNLETFLVDVIDASLFAQNLALAFESLGYGMCFIGGLRNHLPEASRLLEIPADVFPLFGLCVGVPSSEGLRGSVRPRLPLDAIWFKDRWPDEERTRAAIREHDREMAAEFERRGLPGRNWSGGVARKLSKLQREHLAAFYRSQGARLELP